MEWDASVVFSEEREGQVPGVAGVTSRGRRGARGGTVRNINVMTFEHRDREKRGTRDWDEPPACALAGVMYEVLQRVIGLRAKFGDGSQIFTK